jgi:hypothetical protein
MMNQMVSMVGPMAHAGQGLHAGFGMPAGMGIVRQGQALSESLGPSLGRSIGVGAEQERPVTNASLGGGPQHQQQPQHEIKAGGQLVPGYPQDMFMVMDERVAKPETYGLRPTWTGGMMGMMTLVRVLEPDLFEKIQALRAEPAGKAAL